MSDVRVELNINIPFIIDFMGACPDFTDPYTDGDYSKYGCYACENLQGDCIRGYRITRRYFRVDDQGNIMLFCPSQESYNRSFPYLAAGCNNCKLRTMGRCRAGHPIIGVVIRSDS